MIATISLVLLLSGMHASFAADCPKGWYRCSQANEAWLNNPIDNTCYSFYKTSVTYDEADSGCTEHLKDTTNSTVEEGAAQLAKVLNEDIHQCLCDIEKEFFDKWSSAWVNADDFGLNPADYLQQNYGTPINTLFATAARCRDNNNNARYNANAENGKKRAICETALPADETCQQCIGHFTKCGDKYECLTGWKGDNCDQLVQESCTTD